jgi:hypothetical protein
VKGFRAPDAGPTPCVHTPAEDQLTDSVPIVPSYFAILPWVINIPDAGPDGG